MKKLLLIPILSIMFLLLYVQAGFAQDCKTMAANKLPTFVRSADSYFDFGFYNAKPAKWNITKMKARLSTAENWVKKLFTGFNGAKQTYMNYYTLDFVVGKDLGDINSKGDIFYAATGIKGYYEGKMKFFAYYCYDNNNTIQTEAESGSGVTVIFNNIFTSGLVTDAGVYTVNGKHAFKIFQKKRSEDRIDFYEQRAQDNATAKMYTTNDYIILRNSDKSVFISITRKEYLEQMLKDVESWDPKDNKMMNDIYTQNFKSFEAEMKAYKQDKNYTPEKEAKRRKWFEEDQAKLKKQNSKISPGADAAKEVIQQYLQKPAAWLNKGLNNFYSFSTYTAAGVTQFIEDLDKIRRNGVGEIEEETPEEIVYLNPEYFNNKITADVPQLITVYVQNKNYAHMVKAAALVKQPAALAPLAALLK